MDVINNLTDLEKKIYDRKIVEISINMYPTVKPKKGVVYINVKVADLTIYFYYGTFDDWIINTPLINLERKLNDTSNLLRFFYVNSDYPEFQQLLQIKDSLKFKLESKQHDNRTVIMKWNIITDIRYKSSKKMKNK